MITKGIHLRADNGLSHSSRGEVEESKGCGFEILPHPPYCRELTLSDFGLLTELNKPLHSRRFDNSNEIIREMR